MINKLLKALKILLWDFSQLSNLRYGVAAAIEHKDVLSSLEFSNLVDVGANQGQFSLLVSCLKPNVRIYAFEPLKEPRERFSNLFYDNENVIIFPYAIGEVESKSDIHVSKRQDSSSLLPIGDLQSEIYPGTDESHVESIDVRRLEDIISETDLVGSSVLKIDVQGFELSVLRGALSLFPCFDHIYVECSFVELYEGQAYAADVIEYLREHQFIIDGIYNLSYDKFGVAVQADLLFSRVV